MKTNILADIQICISVPLTPYWEQAPLKHLKFNFNSLPLAREYILCHGTLP